MDFQSTIHIILLFSGPIILVGLLLALSTLVSKILLAILKPITEPFEKIFHLLNNCLNSIVDGFTPYSIISDFWGNWKLVIFMIGITIYLLITVVPICISGNFPEFWEQLLPNTSLGIMLDFVDQGSKIGSSLLASNKVEPDTYLRIIIISTVSSFFLTACSNKETSDKNINWKVQILYIFLFTIFSAVVMTKLPEDFLVVPDFKIDLQIQSHDLESFSITEDSKFIPTFIYVIRYLAEVFWIPLFNKLISFIPLLISIYFLCNSLTGFAASVLGGGFTLIISIILHGALEGFADSPLGYVFLAFLLLSVSEFIALIITEKLNEMADEIIIDGISPLVTKYVNLISILTSYFTLPLLGVLILFIFVSEREFFTISIGIPLCIFLFVVYVILCLPGFFYYRFQASGENIVRTIFRYLCSMIFNIPTWIMYFVFFDLFSFFSF